ncbi:Uncharacterised protein [uncultured archaeon]|nr:Uncharacterised protein [uncultured archaeon]
MALQDAHDVFPNYGNLDTEYLDMLLKLNSLINNPVFDLADQPLFGPDGKPLPTRPDYSKVPIQKIEVHIELLCSDARAENELAVEVRESLAHEKRGQGVLVDYAPFALAGTFVEPLLPQMMDEMAARVEAHSELAKKGVPIEVYFHVVAHGEVRLKEGAPGRFEPDELEIMPHSKRACGMGHVQELSVKFTDELLNDLPLDLHVMDSAGSGSVVPIRTPDDLRAFMRQHYGFDGLPSEGWVRNIEDIRFHAKEQGEILQNAVQAHPLSKKVKIFVDAAVDDLADSLFRVDGKPGQITFNDEYHRLVREARAGHHPEEMALRDATQAPLMGCISHTSILNPQATALADWRNLPYRAGRVFTILTNYIDRPEQLFTRHEIMAFYYGITALKLNEWMFIGQTDKDEQGIRAKLLNDPFGYRICEKYSRELILVPNVGPGYTAQQLKRLVGTEVNKDPVFSVREFLNQAEKNKKQKEKPGAGTAKKIIP